MATTVQQVLGSTLRQDCAFEDGLREIHETIAALYRAAAELSMSDPEGARFVISVARNMEKESAPVSVARRLDV